MAENSPLTIIRKMARAKPAERIKLRKKLIDGMMPALRKWFESVEDRITDMVQRGLLFYWKIGSEANDVRSDHKKYGEHAIESCVAALQEDKSVLYKAVRFFKAYDGDELKHLLSLRIQGTGRPILWSHVIVLITVENKAKREVYTQKLIQHGWTDEELNEYIKRERGQPSSVVASTRGRRPKVPATFDKMLSNMNENSAPFEKRFREVWLNDSHGVLRRFNDTDPSEITAGYIQEIDAIDTQWASTIECLNLGRKHLAQIRKRAVANLQQRSRQKGAADAEALANGAPPRTKPKATKATMAVE